MRRVVPVLAAVLLLAGCGSSSSGGSSLPTLATTTAPTVTTPPVTPTTTPVVDPSPWTALPKRDVGPNKGVYTGAVLASSVATTPAEKDAAEAWFRFWEYLTKVGDSGRAGKGQLATIASGNAAVNIENYAKLLQQKNRRTIGWVSLNITSITVGQGATLLSGCVDNGTYDIDRSSGKRLEQGSLAWDAEAAARVVDGHLVITSSGTKLRSKRCPTGQ